MATTSYAVVGASRGIGLEFVRQLAERPGVVVFAIVRSASSSTHLAATVKGLKNVHTIEADVVDYRTLEEAAKNISAVTGGKLDCLIHNAARAVSANVYKGFDDFTNMDELDEDFIDSYKINALGVIHSIAAFLPLLRAAATKKIVVIGAGAADPKVARGLGLGNLAAYSMTKAAALMATTKWAVQLKDEGFAVVSLSPGVVDTTGTVAAGESGIAEMRDIWLRCADDGFEMQTPEQAVVAQLKVIDGLQPSDNGSFMAHTGGEWTF